MMVTITLNESGYKMQLDTEVYEQACRQVGCDSPTDWGIEYTDATWVGADYAAQDPAWSVPAGWPDRLPLWEDRV